MPKAKVSKALAISGSEAEIATVSATMPATRSRGVRKKVNKDYQDKGVLLSREVSTVYEPVKITYDGLLAQNGATELYAHAGIGSDWENVQEVKMAKTKAGGFEATMLAAEKSTLNVCFRDAAYNWDNNSSENYVFSVTQ
ncbi:MAG: carbohydrate-binding protein [Negativicutes bacterium]|nr:carbohydrate-binding protein [Negativicutes bacterium]